MYRYSLFSLTLVKFSLIIEYVTHKVNSFLILNGLTKLFLAVVYI